ncbi:MAG: peptidoglycan bridge formation glycyltransferase FemA/FemB family protein [Spirochaetales bacterium]|nr:peptidoglycan bridge formation glycyltransferase FemA/FemB family protein [Spirochaetales bacterium]
MVRSVSLDELAQTTTLLQSGLWGRIKADYSWTPHAFMYNNVPLLVLVRKLPGGVTIGYVPHGPVTPMDLPFFSKFAESLRGSLPGVTFLRFDLPWKKKLSPVLGKPFCKSPVEIQPPDTVIIDLTKSDEELLSGMKKKTRYNIRLAEKKGVTVKRTGIEGLSCWYELYQETSLRDNIQIHSYDYYLTVYSHCENDPEATPVLLLSYFNDIVVSGIFLVFYGNRATYLYGASSDAHRDVMPNYLLQWEGLRLARESGCTEYDMFGIPPTDDPGHPMYGLYRFKTGFGGRIDHMEGCWDYPFKHLSYRLFRWAEILRNLYYKKIKKMK